MTEETATSRTLAALRARLEDGDQRMAAIERQLAENTRLTAANAEITQTIKELLDGARAGLRVLAGLGFAVKWTGGIAGGVTALWVAWQTMKEGGKQ